jgi:hypothetical protein
MGQQVEVVKALSMRLWYVKLNGITLDSADTKWQARDLAKSYQSIMWKSSYNEVIKHA